MTALDDIATERARQISEEGWTPEHDDEHEDGDLAIAAASYAYLAGREERARYRSRTGVATTAPNRDVPGTWPWEADWWKPKDARRDLVRAAALIVAEIERLDRALVQAPDKTQEDGK